MRNYASTVPVFAAPASPRPADRSWSERLMERVLGLPPLEEAERHLRSQPGFIARLTPAQIAAIQASDEFEVLGPANGPRRQF